MVLFVLSLPVLIGVTGLVVDLTNLYTRRAVAQRAADAAALAGAMVAAPDSTTASGSNDDVIIAEAKSYGKLNGYTDSQITVYPHVGGQLGKVQVNVARSEPLFFLPALEVLLGDGFQNSRRIGANATAQKIQDIALSLGGNYGTTTGASNPAAFGPDALHSFGDPYSVLFYDDGTPNTPENVSHNQGTGWDSTSHYNPDGFSYTMTVSPTYVAAHQTLRVELYDPDCHDSKDLQSLDEIHADKSGQTSPTTTEYNIFKVLDNGTLQKVPDASATYGDDASVDAAALKAQGKNPWITPKGFDLDMATLGAGKYKIQVKTLSGSSENGYNLRAGPEYPDAPVDPSRTDEGWSQLEKNWNDSYGDKGGSDPYNTMVPIQADNHLQMNFTRTDHVKVRLGEVPESAAGKELTVTKFDTDVGSTNIKYSFSPKSDPSTSIAAEGQDFLTPTNDFWSQNQVKVPDGFKGGFVYAEYDAGQNDTSSWSVKVPGVLPGSVKLVK